MTGKIFLYGNLLLAAFFACSLFALYGQIRHEKTKGRSIVEYSPVGIKRPHLELGEKYRNIFSVKPMVIAKEKPRHGNSGGALNELVSGDECVRVQGIFISGDVRYAVFSIFDKKKKREKVKGKKVGIGDKIKDYSVVAILPGHIGLAHSSSEEIDLKIFKPLSCLSNSQN